MERSKIPLTKWLYATYLLMSSKKGMSTQQLHRTLGVRLKSTWFLMHRIREALREGGSPFTPLGGKGKKVEIDETYVRGKEKNKHASRRQHVGTSGAGKEAVFDLVERSRARQLSVGRCGSARTSSYQPRGNAPVGRAEK